jgi:hypothetical protein
LAKGKNRKKSFFLPDLPSLCITIPNIGWIPSVTATLLWLHFGTLNGPGWLPPQSIAIGLSTISKRWEEGSFWLWEMEIR